MTAAWMSLALMMGVLIALGARLAERSLRHVGRGARAVWAAALALTVVITAVAPLRLAPLRPAVSALVLRPGARDASRPPGEQAGRSSAAWTAPLTRASASVARALGPVASHRLAVVWAVLSAVMLAAFTATYYRVRRARRTWPVVTLAGDVVRLAPRAGPAAMGLRHPDIVVPRWLLGRSAAEQRLVVAHEREHVRGGDPWLLALGCAAAVLLPWHPAVWWMLARLRLAAEVDCDRRVLRRGVDAVTYGSLLVELAARGPALGAGALALAGNPSNLERRLLAMQTKPLRFSRSRAAVLGALALAAVVVACDGRLPTSAEIARMDVAGAQRAVLAPLGEQGVVGYKIDGRAATKQEALAIPGARIASIEVVKGGGSGRSEVRIATRTGGDTIGIAAGSIALHEATGTRAVDGARRGLRMQPDSGGFTGVLVLDGVRMLPSQLAAVRPGDIASVEVVKGERALRLYPTPAARNGVVLITTKRPPAKP